MKMKDQYRMKYIKKGFISIQSQSSHKLAYQNAQIELDYSLPKNTVEEFMENLSSPQCFRIF
ncbi:unnamed protein product [Paramecium primaurelia]|uniref:Uncharacterized protein n=1 Tax=Paramecium primaurelia TaxID=5886 RepID=A0A8S1NE69_PARPR|nr:unnamed protein product [Paramecium primaurelia]